MLEHSLIYDIEIVKAIPDKRSPQIPNIEYCEGWHDHLGMGISVIGAYDSAEDRYRVFCKDNFQEFQNLLVKRDILVTFNGIGFDNKVLKANGIAVPADSQYDLLVEIWLAHGLQPTFQYPTHIGFGLDACCSRNFKMRKTGDGALAPINWQQGLYGTVIDYCLQDVRLTKKLYELTLEANQIISPKTGELVNIRSPHEAIGL